MLELRKLLTEVESMSQELANRQEAYTTLAQRAEAALRTFAEVDDELLAKIHRAIDADSSWRGARPVGSRLDERHSPQTAPRDATLIAVDGSQIYPDRHGLAIYYLINTGAFVLRQGTGEAPQTSTQPEIFYREADLYNDDQELVDSRVVNSLREMAELKELARLAAQERRHWQGDLDRLILALNDGPLLLWMGEREYEQSSEAKQRLRRYLSYFEELQSARGIPVGYVDRPRSANVLRLLHVAELELEQISKEALRATRYRGLTDRLLFNWLEPNERSALFASTARINRSDFAQAGQEIHFFYLNVSERPGRDEARIVRVDVPAWVSGQTDLLDQVQQAIHRDCKGSGYPYALARAHELAVVTQHERREFEQMLAAEMWRHGLTPAPSQKAFLKGLS